MLIKKLGVLIVNLGTPEKPTPNAIRRYLNTFLSDPRVVPLPRWLWLPLLKIVITPLRSRRLARLYQKIWLPQGSPLYVYTEELAIKLAPSLTQITGQPCFVEAAMCYSKPSIVDGLLKLRAQQITHLMILPLYPQYSSTTTAAVFDQVGQAFKPCPHLPWITFIRDYCLQTAYINAIAESVTTFYKTHSKPQQLIFSFHGLPQSIADKGDPYPQQCEETASAVAKQLGLTADDYMLTYQSRFGKAKWLLPETLATMKTLPTQGINAIAVICPGFAVDCLETLEEIALVNRQAFLDAGGQTFHYIPALNASELHVKALSEIIDTHLQATINA